MGSQRTCFNTHHISWELLNAGVLDELQKLVKWHKQWSLGQNHCCKVSRIAGNYSETDNATKIDKRQNELGKCLATAYEDKVKGVMDGEPFVLRSNQFKECDQQEEARQKIQV